MRYLVESKFAIAVVTAANAEDAALAAAPRLMLKDDDVDGEVVRVSEIAEPPTAGIRLRKRFEVV